MKRVRRVPKLPARAEGAHKGDFGRVLVIAGSATMLGAAVLCARGAVRGGAGLVRVLLPDELVPLLPLALPEATTGSRSAASLRSQLAAADAVVVGPGLGATASTRQCVQRVLRAPEPAVVLDADALNVLAPLAARAARRARLVLTPHPGEAARLLGTSTAAVQQDRDAAVSELCRRSGAVVVLKGARTLVADGARCFVNTTGNPGMATGGSGDVLAGLLGAVLAAGLEPFDAACLAVHVHGAAGDLIASRRGQAGLAASDLPEAIAEVLP